MVQSGYCRVFVCQPPCPVWPTCYPPSLKFHFLLPSRSSFSRDFFSPSSLSSSSPYMRTTAMPIHHVGVTVSPANRHPQLLARHHCPPQQRRSHYRFTTSPTTFDLTPSPMLRSSSSHRAVQLRGLIVATRGRSRGAEQQRLVHRRCKTRVHLI